MASPLSLVMRHQLKGFSGLLTSVAVLLLLACQPDAPPAGAPTVQPAVQGDSTQPKGAATGDGNVWKKLNKTLAEAKNKEQATTAQLQSHARFVDFWADFRKAVLSGDKETVSAYVNFPFEDGNDVYGKERSLACSHKAAFIKQYDRIFSPAVRAAIVANTYRGHQVFEEDTVEDTIGEKDFVLEAGFDEHSRTRDLLFKLVDGQYKLVGLPYYP